jgi:hypothetical protein
MKVNPIKLCREAWSRSIQHIRAAKEQTRLANRRLRHETKRALKQDEEPPVTKTGGERY